MIYIYVLQSHDEKKQLGVQTTPFQVQDVIAWYFIVGLLVYPLQLLALRALILHLGSKKFEESWQSRQ